MTGNIYNRQELEILLMDYAAGALDEAVSLLLASFLTLSPEARRFVRQCEQIGGALMEEFCDPVEMAENSLHAVLARLDYEPQPDSPCRAEHEDPSLPHPVVRYMEVEYTSSRVEWRGTVTRTQFCNIRIKESPRKVALLKIAPGTKAPHHIHNDMEMALVLEGALYDETGRYRRGDLFIADETITTRPVADREQGCMCMTLVHHPVQPSGLLDQILESLFRS